LFIIFDNPLFSYNIPIEGPSALLPKKYSIDITARNGHFQQEIIIDVKNNHLNVHSRIEKIITDKKRVVLREYETIDSAYFTIPF
jgi:hypothetical protein